MEAVDEICRVIHGRARRPGETVLAADALREAACDTPALRARVPPHSTSAISLPVWREIHAVVSESRLFEI